MPRSPKIRSRSELLCEGLQIPQWTTISGHLLTCQTPTVRRCRELSRAAHLSSGLNSQSSPPTSPAQCCEPLCNYSDLLRLTGFTLKTVTTHNTFCVKMDTAVAISELNTSRGSHSFFPDFFFFFLNWTLLVLAPRARQHFAVIS